MNKRDNARKKIFESIRIIAIEAWQRYLDTNDTNQAQTLVASHVIRDHQTLIDEFRAWGPIQRLDVATIRGHLQIPTCF